MISAVPEALRRVKRGDLSCYIHDKACRGWCRLIGHSGGVCTNENECMCSEEDLEKYVCSNEVKPKTQKKLCAGWCQIFRQKQTGNCDLEAKECMCDDTDLEISHSKCVSDFVCRMYCQAVERKATGKCTGENNWDCSCVSNPKVSANIIDIDDQDDL